MFKISSVQFPVECNKCNKITNAKVRVRCSNCLFEAIEIEKDTLTFEDLITNKIKGNCSYCDEYLDQKEQNTQFFFKCNNEIQGKICKNENVTLLNISLAGKSKECIFCYTEFNENDIAINFGCETKICIRCFQNFSSTQLKNLRFRLDKDSGHYSLKCPDNNCNKYIKNVLLFKYLPKEDYEDYKKLGLEENFKNLETFTKCPLGKCDNPAVLISNPKIKYVKCTNCSGVFCKDCKMEFLQCPCEVNNNVKEEDYEEDLFLPDPNPVKNETARIVSISINQKYYQIQVYPSYTSKEAKIIISNLLKYGYNKIRLFIAGRELPDNVKFHQWNINEMSMIHAIVKIKNEKMEIKKEISEEEMKKRFEVLKKNGIYLCPKCKSYSEKDDGCNHVQCENLQCKIHYCWICVEFSSDHGKDVYDHIEEKHPNQLFYVPPEE